jgi:hypothetical protein
VNKALVAVLGLLLGLYIFHAWSSSAAPPKAARKPSGTSAPSVAPPSAATDEVRYIAVGGGATPEYTEVSLEQDIQLATQVLRGPGVVLFAGGSASSSVRTLATPALPGSLLQRLGELFDPRSGRESRYRRTLLTALPATAENFEKSFAQALRAGREPLLVYIASHGLQGEQARDNHVELWGGEPLDVVHLDKLEGNAERPVRFVIASCYAGGFAELAFKHADAEQGPTHAPRCGLFAGTWDRQTSGCDPNPDRREQEGYSMHVLHALRGEDRAGKALPLSQLDLDGDGKVSLLEAHTRARIVSQSIDVPTTTSERYLRAVEQHPLAPNLKLLPEEAAVVRQLGARLHLPSKAAAEKRYAELGARLDALQDELDSADAELERMQGRLAAQLLARWPVLNDPYHDEFAATLSQNAAAIQKVLTESAEASQYRRARSHAEELSARASALDPDEAVVLRLVRAYETLSLATALTAHGGPGLAHYQALLACERGVP